MKKDTSAQKPIEPTAEKESIKQYYIKYPNENFSGVSAQIAFKDGKSIIPISDAEKLKMFENLGYSLELIEE